MPQAIPLLRDPSPRVRAGVTRLLGYVAGEDVLPALFAALQQGLLPPSIVTMAVLRIFPRDSAPIRACVSSEVPQVRRVAAMIARFMVLSDLRPDLEQLLVDPDIEVRIAAAEALGTFGDFRSLAPLRHQLTKDSEPEEHRVVVTAIQDCMVSDESNGTGELS